MDLVKLQKKIIPEMFKMLELRYDILRSIYFNQPIGRRNLAENLNITERVVRAEIQILKELELLNIESMGMYITSEGKIVLTEITKLIHELRGISELEKQLKTALNLKRVIVVESNLNEYDITLKEMGKASNEYLKQTLRDDFIVGITGGTTMLNVAKSVKKEKISNNLLVIPARGGLGKDVETQSNNVAATLAKRLEGNYKLLHVPDNMDEKTLDALMELSNINEVINLIEDMDVLLFGVGRADVMARTRNLSKEKIEWLYEKGAVAEAFGYYFDIDGNQLWEYKTIGLSIERFKSLKEAIAVAGKEEKAEAIIAIAKIKPDITLITDELAAKKILSIIN